MVACLSSIFLQAIRHLDDAGSFHDKTISPFRKTLELAIKAPIPERNGYYLMVPTIRLELIRPKSLPPQDSVSTNFTTSAQPNRYHEVASMFTRSPRINPNISTYLGISFAFEPASEEPPALSALLGAGTETACDCTASCITLPEVFGLFDAT